ncbi:LDCC motif putative metal-binding protein [Anaerocolumna cellulosilytica]|uniref:LDCC motif putative metal-binding protein n=1 Tax=Anaerocolumna cellulosilytica TaxID=433286 RepID=UPI003A7F29A7
MQRRDFLYTKINLKRIAQLLEKLKKAIQKFLLDMAKENEELYGKERMDCCKLNRIKKR